MMRVLSSLGGQHAAWLVILAVALCVATSLTAMRLFARAQASHGAPRRGWLLMTAFAAGIGIWATHFLALLGYEPGLPVAYSLDYTGLSLAVAVISAAAGAAVAVAGKGRVFRLAGGAVVGAGIALMHLTAMGALTILPDPAMAVSPMAVPDFVLALCVSASALIILGIGNAVQLIHAGVEQDSDSRFHAFADAAMDSIVLAEKGKIYYANKQLCRLLECGREELHGKELIGNFLELPAHAVTPDATVLTEGTLKAAQGARIPVEILSRPIRYTGKDYHVYSLRDLREKRHAQSKIRFFAEHDSLTGLANRTLFTAQVNEALAKAGESSIAAFLIDLDQLKAVNDIYGFAAGDAILRGVGTRLRAFGREDVQCARLSGDEFAVMLSNASRESADKLAQDIIRSLSEPFLFGGDRIALGCSAGIALSPKDGLAPGELLAHAEIAMRRAKESGRGRYCFFEADLDTQVHERRALAFALTNAIAEDQFEIYYQPLSLISSREVIGFEALLRWRHPDRGIISPALFIPIAEETEAIREIGAWVLRKVCEEAAGWPNPLKVAVNLSPVQLEDTGLPETVQAILFETGMSAERLELEVTETALIRNPQRSLDVLESFCS